MSTIVRVGKRYTIVIPKEVREKLGLKEGSKLLLRIYGEKSLILEPLPDNPFKVLEEVIGEPYKEDVDEKKAVEWLMKDASG
ncbi:MAG: AbrB/MazE/SpoVT family DNA-binding domain-containing protein [Thermoprotei archaeon]|nr:MAG: AbrB/MazE/SpoVT family DNA-binding domain-containing protein [Thermoprotei archaeon]